MFDCHLHTNHSHDGKSELSEVCESALDAGLAGIAVTDHADIEYAADGHVRIACRETFEDCELYKEKYRGKLEIASGIEFGEYTWNTPEAEKILADSEYDIVLTSVHAVRLPGFTQPFAQIDFTNLSDEQIQLFLLQYFTDYLDNLEHSPTDAATHLTVPLRYIVGKYSRQVDLNVYSEQIDRILRKVIEKNIPLEINTSCLGGGYDKLMPDENIITRYRTLGGRKITFASDAHKAEKVGYRFDSAVGILHSLGFRTAIYFKRRKEIEYLF